MNEKKRMKKKEDVSAYDAILYIFCTSMHITKMTFYGLFNFLHGVGLQKRHSKQNAISISHNVFPT